MNNSEILNRFMYGLVETHHRNEELVNCLEDAGERFDHYDEGTRNTMVTIRACISEALKPNQTVVREMESLMKLLEARLTEVRNQEKHNEKQIITLESERREVFAQKAAIDEDKRALASDKEKMEDKLDKQRAELGMRAQKLCNMEIILTSDVETTVDAAVIHEAERSKLRSELALMKKTEEIRGLESMCEQYREEIKKVRDEAKDAIAMSESQAKEACKRLQQMNNELLKSQDTARKIQQLLMGEKDKTKELKSALDHERLQPISRHLTSSLQGESVEGNLATIPGLSRALIQRAAKAGNMGTATRIEEVLKKNEMLREEVIELREIVKRTQYDMNRLKDDAKTSCTKLHYSQMQVITLQQARGDALGKLKKAQLNYETLNRSLTRQAASWVQERINERTADEAHRMKKILPRVS